ncbi:hypothetical protein [Kaarinaea lacus]
MYQNCLEIFKIKYIFVVLTILSVNACSSNDGTSVDVEAICNVEPSSRDIIVNTDDGQESHGLNKKYNIYITANRSFVTILEGSPVGNLYLQGDNNILKFESNITVDVFCISGSDNTLLIPFDLEISVDLDTGQGNYVTGY